MNKININIFYLYLIGFASLFICCNDESDDAEPVKTEQVEGSMISELETNWIHFRFSQGFYSGRSGSSFETDIDFFQGAVYLEQPIFLTSHFFIRGGIREIPSIKLTSRESSN